TRHTHSTSYYFFLTDPAPPDTYTLSLHDALPICADLSSFLPARRESGACGAPLAFVPALPAIDAGRKIRQPHREPRRGHREQARSEEHTSELQSQSNLVCRLLLEKKKKQQSKTQR